MQLGPARYAVSARTEAARRPFEHRLIVRRMSFRLANDSKAPAIHELYGALAADERRNELILNDVITALHEGRSPILLTERKDHLVFLSGSGGSPGISWSSTKR
jgi:hypothetical protein